MQSFHWDRHFITGLTEVDAQHHHLVDLINEFGNLVADNKVEPDDIEAIFKELTDYTLYHFKEEESLMFKTGVDQRHVRNHMDFHKHFVQQVMSLHSEIILDNSSTTPSSLLNFLVNWLAFHILVTDQNMAHQIRTIQSGVSADEAFDKAEQKSDDATKPLVKALDGLFKQISQRNKDLVKLNLSLEAKVAERTKELSKANIRLEKLSLTDALTGLPNRRHAMQRFTDLWHESTKNNLPLACMMVDADHFKEVNDTYGHDAGDLVLCELSKTLQHAVRNDDIVCRMGGDEFFIICPDTDKEGALHLAKQVLDRVVALRVPTGSGTWHGSISIGVAARSADMTRYIDLVKLADEGVYQAKKAGKSCVRPVG